MALHNTTACTRILLVRGREHLYVDRYETWVQYRSRELPKRVDLRPLADRLTDLEPGVAKWSASPPSGLTPTLRANPPSGLGTLTIRAELISHLRSAPAAWDPFAIIGADES